MEVQAYIKIRTNRTGDFQFGLVSGEIDGEISKQSSRERFEFTWEGNDEIDSASGNGWIKLKNESTIEGKIKIQQGDSSRFLAQHVK